MLHYLDSSFKPGHGWSSSWTCRNRKDRNYQRFRKSRRIACHRFQLFRPDEQRFNGPNIHGFVSIWSLGMFRLIQQNFFRSVVRHLDSSQNMFRCPKIEKKKIHIFRRRIIKSVRHCRFLHYNESRLRR